MTPDPIRHLADAACEGVAHCEEIVEALGRGDLAAVEERAEHLRWLLVAAVRPVLSLTRPHTPDRRRAA